MIRSRAGWVLFASAAVLLARASHDESIGARFVQSIGADAGECLDHHAPCRSIHYALSQAESGNTVKVGVGIFDLSDLDPESFLHGPVHATGGYNEDDHYAASRPSQVRSVAVGVDARYRNALAVRGFHWAADSAAAQRGEITFGGGSALQASANAAATCTQGAAGLFPCRNFDLLSQIALNQFSSQPVSAANVWGLVDLNDNREYAVIGLSNGTAVVDVTDPVNPRQVGTVPGNASLWREVKVHQYRDVPANRWRAYVYVTTEAANSGVQVIDLSGLPNSVSLVNTLRDTGSQHALYVSNIEYAGNTTLPGAVPFLYLAGANLNGGAWRAYSLANPAAPLLVGVAPMSTRYMHDSTGLYLTDARTAQCAPGHNPCEVLIDFNVNHVEVWDVTNKALPVLLSAVTNPNNRYIHSGWPTSDQRHVIFHDELDEIQAGVATSIYTLNLDNLRAPLVTTSHVGSTTTTDHNGYTRGNYYYVSHYRRGLVVFDVSNPNQLVEVGHFDNYLAPAANSAGTDGTWGVYPFLPSGNILISDIENGLFVVRDFAQTFAQRPGRVGFAATALSAAESAGNAVIRVQRVTGSAGVVSVQYASSDGTAASSSDYTAVSGTLTWPAGDLTDKLISVPIANDGLNEGAETLRVTLTAPNGGATLDGASQFEVTLSDSGAAGGTGGSRSGGGAMHGLELFMIFALILAAALRRGTYNYAPRPRVGAFGIRWNGHQEENHSRPGGTPLSQRLCQRAGHRGLARRAARGS